MSQAQSTKTAGQAAAEWWAEQIGAPVFKIVPEGDHEDRQFGDTTSMLAGILASRHPVKDGQGEAFVAALAPVIDEGLARCSSQTLGVDYGPDRKLAEAAQKAGIHPGRFPFKTNMWVKPDHVTAALGYGASAKLIWSAPDWVRPACGQHSYDPEGFVLAANEICTKPRYHEDGHGEWRPDPERCSECGKGYADHYGKDKWEAVKHSYAVAS